MERQAQIQLNSSMNQHGSITQEHKNLDDYEVNLSKPLSIGEMRQRAYQHELADKESKFRDHNEDNHQSESSLLIKRASLNSNYGIRKSFESGTIRLRKQSAQ